MPGEGRNSIGTACGSNVRNASRTRATGSIDRLESRGMRKEAEGIRSSVGPSLPMVRRSVGGPLRLRPLVKAAIAARSGLVGRAEYPGQQKTGRIAWCVGTISCGSGTAWVNGAIGNRSKSKSIAARQSVSAARPPVDSGVGSMASRIGTRASCAAPNSARSCAPSYEGIRLCGARRADRQQGLTSGARDEMMDACGSKSCSRRIMA